jgi:hypothetical protein
VTVCGVKFLISIFFLLLSLTCLKHSSGSPRGQGEKSKKATSPVFFGRRQNSLDFRIKCHMV